MSRENISYQYKYTTQIIHDLKVLATWATGRCASPLMLALQAIVRTLSVERMRQFNTDSKATSIPAKDHRCSPVSADPGVREYYLVATPFHADTAIQSSKGK